MARMHVMEQSETQAIMSSMHEMLEKRLSVSSLAPCPVEFTASYVAMCATQSCGKCTPCRNGLRMLRHLFNDVLNNRATMETLDLIESTARTVYLSSDCAIGYEAGEVALMAIRGFRDDFEHHVTKHACGFSQHQTVPCVSGCPAGVDIPGYIALVEAGRYTEALRPRLRAPLRDALPSRHGGRPDEHPRPQALRRGPRGGLPPHHQGSHQEDRRGDRRRPGGHLLRLLPDPHGPQGQDLRAARAPRRHAALRPTASPTTACRASSSTPRSSGSSTAASTSSSTTALTARR